MAGYLIKDTTREERQKIVEESLGNISANCDGCMAGVAEMYQDYIDGKKEIRQINMEFAANYNRGDMDKETRRSCMA
ncbi:MAG: purine biosynthesis protein PurH [Eubacterium sp.]|nr:purine biosynthesis protein PurH [Eubacterium sp.]